MKNEFKIKLHCIYILLILGFGSWVYFTEPTPDWDSKSSIQDHASLFLSSHQKELEPLLKQLWNQYQAPTYIITDSNENYSRQYQNISSLLKRNLKKPNIFLIIKSSDNYYLINFYLTTGENKRVRFHSLGSFVTSHQVYIKLLSILENYQQQKQSEKKVKDDFFSAVPAISFVCLIGILFRVLGRFMSKCNTRII